MLVRMKPFVSVGENVSSENRICALPEISESLFDAILKHYPDCDETTQDKIAKTGFALIWHDNLDRLILESNSEELENFLVEFKQEVDVSMFEYLDEKDDSFSWVHAIESVRVLPKLTPDDGQFDEILSDTEILEGVLAVMRYEGVE